MIVDDVQVGCCRAGDFFSFERAGIVPDIVVMSKSIGGIGMPLAIVLLKEELDTWKPGEHNGTFRGNQLSFVAGKAAIEYLTENNVEAETKRKGEIVKNYVEKNILPLDSRLELRGIGLIWGIDFGNLMGDLSEKVIEHCFAKNLICECAGREGSVVKIMPTLVIEDELLLEGLGRLKKSIEEVLKK
jgi:diaminobutyrate-2-oxoglutarate transaminase